MDQLSNSGFKKIAILGLKRIGDAIYTLPAIEALKKEYPNASVDFFTEPQVKDIYLSNPFIDHLFVYSKKNFWFSSLKDLKNNHYDACLVFHNAFKYALLPFLARVPIRVGYVKEMRGALLTHKRPLSSQVIHRLEHNAQLVDFLSAESRGLLPQLFFSESEQERALELLSENGLSSQNYVAFIVGSISPTRRWFPENFAEVANQIDGVLGVPTLILGGPDDVDIANEIVKLVQPGASIINLAGKTSLRDTLLFFKESAAVISNDTGPMHAASAIGVPVVTWFGAANEVEIAPPSPNTTILNANVSCSPCVKESCPYNLECLHEITPNMVFVTLQAKLNA